MTDTNRTNRFLPDKKLPSYVSTANGLREFLIDLDEPGGSKDFAERQQRLDTWLQLLTTSYFELLDHLGKVEEGRQ